MLLILPVGEKIFFFRHVMMLLGGPRGLSEQCSQTPHSLSLRLVGLVLGGMRWGHFRAAR